MININAIELFNKLYNDEIGLEQCIEVIHPDEEDHYIFRDSWGRFYLEELIRCLLFKEYNFKLRNQQEVKEMLKEKERLDRISELEHELNKLKKEDD